MPATEPLSGLSYPVTGDAASWATYYKNLYYGLAGQSVPRFSTSTARDTALTNWVAAGYTAVDGMMAYTQDADTMWIRESGTWRFLSYVGPVAGTFTPVSNLKRLAQSIPNGGSGAQIANWTIDRVHGFLSVNTTTGVTTFNQRGVWSIVGNFSSDATTSGQSAVSMNWSTAPYPIESTVVRGTGGAGAGLLRQSLSWTGYLEAGVTWAAAAYQVNTGAAAANYDVNFQFALIG